MIREDTTTVAPMVVSDWVPITVTPAAAERLKALMAARELEGAGLRVFVQGGGCSGLQYQMAFETAPEADDLVFNAGDIRVYVDPVSIQYLQGARIDFLDDMMQPAFKIDNPNAVSSCGCGHSFKPAGATGSESGQGGGCGSGCG